MIMYYIMTLKYSNYLAGRQMKTFADRFYERGVVLLGGNVTTGRLHSLRHPRERPSQEFIELFHYS